MLTAVLVILVLLLLFGGLGFYISKLFLFGIVAVLLVALMAGAFNYRSHHH